MTREIKVDGKAITKQDVMDMLEREIVYLDSCTWAVGMATEKKEEIWAKVKELEAALCELVWEDEDV